MIDRAQGLDSLRWLPLDGGFAFHVSNAWDDGDALTVDLMLSDAPPLFPGPESSPPADTTSLLTRWSVDLAAAAPRVAARTLSLAEGEFPRVDERFAGRRSRFTFWSSGAALHVRDDADGTEASLVLPDGDGASEPVFVPRGEAEGDGWILAVLYRGASKTSDLAIIDAGALAAGPVALARLPARVPDGFHGAWVRDAA